MSYKPSRCPDCGENVQMCCCQAWAKYTKSGGGGMKTILEDAWDEVQNVCGIWVYETLGAEFDRLAAELTEARETRNALADFGQTYKKLTDLLCRIHRDGGQAIGKYGVDKAYVDAVKIVLQTFDRAEKAESELTRYKQGVEVEGYVIGVPSDIDADMYFASGWSRELGKLKGKVRVLIVKVEG